MALNTREFHWHVDVLNVCGVTLHVNRYIYSWYSGLPPYHWKCDTESDRKVAEGTLSSRGQRSQAAAVEA